MRHRTYVVLLRGVMPTGRNRVPMATLRDVLTRAGFRNVRTYIQSGNVLVDTGLTSKEAAKQVRALIAKHIGPDLVVIVRTGTQMRKMFDGNPFEDGYDRSRVFFIMFEKPPAPQKAKELLKQDFSPEEIVIAGDAAYVYIPGPYVKGRLANHKLEKHFGIASTMRNYNTVSRLVEMSIED